MRGRREFYADIVILLMGCEIPTEISLKYCLVLRSEHEKLHQHKNIKLTENKNDLVSATHYSFLREIFESTLYEV